MATNSNNQFIQVGKITNLASEELTTASRVSTAATSNNELYWVAARGDSYIRRFVNATEAAGTDVTSSGATLGQFLPSGTAIPIALDKNEVLKIDSAGDVVLSRFY